MIYLDNAATSFPKPKSVCDAVYTYMTECGASPSRGSYETALEASRMVLSCQMLLAELFSVSSPERFVFTKNSTEAINTAVFGLIEPGDEIIISSMEHNSVARCAHECVRRGAKLKIARATEKGIVAPESIERLITNKTKLICLIHASNVTGTVNDIYSVAKIAKKHNVLTLFDLAQSAGIIPIDAQEFDMFTFSGHKGLLGPMGTGGLYVREGINLKPLLYGGTGSYSESASMPDFFPDRFHAGTLNASGIAGLCEGIKFILENDVYQKEREISSYLVSALMDIKGIKVLGEGERVSAISIVTKGYDPVLLGEKLWEEYSVATRSGLHCSPMAHRSLGTITSGTLRFSPGFFTEKEDVDFAVNALKKILGK